MSNLIKEIRGEKYLALSVVGNLGQTRLDTQVTQNVNILINI